MRQFTLGPVSGHFAARQLLVDLFPKPPTCVCFCVCVQICDFGMARARKPDDEEETVALWTDYVASRWYRAPELICCYLTRYTAAIDVWSIGCIASELLLRKALFPGKNGEQQLELITDLVGAPSREDMQSLRSSRVKELLRTMRGKKPTDFRSFYPPEADDLELDLIKEMVTFSADKRESEPRPPPSLRLEISPALHPAILCEFLSMFSDSNCSRVPRYCRHRRERGGAAPVLRRDPRAAGRADTLRGNATAGQVRVCL